MKKIVRNTIVFICLLLLLLVGCTKDKHSTMQYYNLSEREKTIAGFSSDWFGIYDFSFQDDVQGAALYLDQWQNGGRVHSVLIASGSTTYLKSCYISVKDLIDKNNQNIGQAWDLRLASLDGFRKDGPVEVKFPKDQVIATCDCVKFLGEDGPKENRLRPNNNYILAVQSCQFGESAGDLITCETLMKKPEQIKMSDYVVVLRLQTFATKKEAIDVK